jgi:hypothetical protein
MTFGASNYLELWIYVFNSAIAFSLVHSWQPSGRKPLGRVGFEMMSGVWVGIPEVLRGRQHVPDLALSELQAGAIETRAELVRKRF